MPLAEIFVAGPFLSTLGERESAFTKTVPKPNDRGDSLTDNSNSFTVSLFRKAYSKYDIDRHRGMSEGKALKL